MLLLTFCSLCVRERERVLLKLPAQEGTEIIPGIVNAIKTDTYDILLGRELHMMDQCLWEASPPGSIKKGRKKRICRLHEPSVTTSDAADYLGDLVQATY